MMRVLLVALVPESVDFTDPALPPGLDAQQIHAAIAGSMQTMTERGWHADCCFILPDETAPVAVEQQLAASEYDCVVIGAGIRLPSQNLKLFEALVNAVHRGAPGASIAFNTGPDSTADAVARWV